jgi:hypothetical protein
MDDLVQVNDVPSAGPGWPFFRSKWQAACKSASAVR